MTNEDISKQIATGNRGYYPDANNFQDYKERYSAALEMAEYKDNILREEREKAINKFNEYYDNHLNLSIASRYAGVAFFVDKLLGEDSRDKFHCPFATMD